mgnify:CR=1 FL=1
MKEVQGKKYHEISPCGEFGLVVYHPHEEKSGAQLWAWINSKDDDGNSIATNVGEIMDRRNFELAIDNFNEEMAAECAMWENIAKKEGWI